MNTNAQKRAHNDLCDWADWSIRHMERSSIGYPNRTAEGRMIQDGVGIQGGCFGSRCPEVMMPLHIQRVDQAIRAMVWSVMIAVLCKYYPERAMQEAGMEHQEDWHIRSRPKLHRNTVKWTDGDRVRLFSHITGLRVNDYYARWRVAQETVASARNTNGRF